MNLHDKTLIFTDGACSGNPGPGGYGTVIVKPEGDVLELGGGFKDTTNNRMEMFAILQGLETITKTDSQIIILTDSTYVIRGMTQWIGGWKRKGWKSATGKEVSNRDLWIRLDELVQQIGKKSRIEWGYIRGHQGNPGNERCDEIAVAFSKNKFVELFKGKLLDYNIPIYDLPENLDLPAQKSSNDRSSSKNKKAFSYVSFVDGKIFKDSNWKDCEARVKGRSGVRFKKSFSKEDELEIIKDWTKN